MPRKIPSRLELRKQAEAAEKLAVPKKAKKKKVAKKRTTRRTKDAAPERKRLVWVIYTATLREEARFPYDQRAEAEEKLETLLAKGKRTYFMQPVKELVSGGPAPTAAAAEDDEENDVVEDVDNNDSDEDDVDQDSDDDDDDDEEGGGDDEEEAPDDDD